MLQRLGVPYTDEQVAQADVHAEQEAKTIADALRGQGVEDEYLEQKEIIALIAYLQVARAEDHRNRRGRRGFTIMFKMFKEALKGYDRIEPSIWALILFVIVFIGIVLWTYRRSAKSHHNYMSNLPLDGRDSK